jgi:hypothetical protein
MTSIDDVTRAAFATSVAHTRPLGVPGPLRRAALLIGELLAAVGVVLCIPFAILAIGIPVALFVRFLLWIVGML